MNTHTLGLSGVKVLNIYPEMSCVMRKPGFCICENKGTDQLRG